MQYGPEKPEMAVTPSAPPGSLLWKSITLLFTAVANRALPRRRCDHLRVIVPYCLPALGGCQVLIFAQKFFHGKKHHLQKSGKNVRRCRIFLCEPNMNIHNPHSLWKTLVDNSVENVENYEFSTGISLLCKFFTTCGKACIEGCIKPHLPFPAASYVTGTNRLFP